MQKCEGAGTYSLFYLIAWRFGFSLGASSGRSSCLLCSRGLGYAAAIVSKLCGTAVLIFLPVVEYSRIS